MLQYSQRRLGGLAIGILTDKSMMGIELGVSAGPGEEGLEFARVVGVGAASPPSTSLSMAESSINKNYLFLGSTTKRHCWRRTKRRKKKRRRRAYSFSGRSEATRLERKEFGRSDDE